MVLIGYFPDFGVNVASTAVFQGDGVSSGLEFEAWRKLPKIVDMTKDLAAYAVVHSSHGFSEIWAYCVLLKVNPLLGSISLSLDLSPSNSVAAGTGGVIGPHYASSKSAMHGLLHWIAIRYAKEGIVGCLVCLRD